MTLYNFLYLYRLVDKNIRGLVSLFQEFNVLEGKVIALQYLLRILINKMLKKIYFTILCELFF